MRVLGSSALLYLEELDFKDEFRDWAAPFLRTPVSRKARCGPKPTSPTTLSLHPDHAMLEPLQQPVAYQPEMTKPPAPGFGRPDSRSRRIESLRYCPHDHAALLPPRGPLSSVLSAEPLLRAA